MISKPALVASFRLSFGLLCCVPGLGFGQNAISTGTKAGFRMYYPNSNDWWLDPSHGNLDFRVNGQAAFASFNSSGYLGIGTTGPVERLDLLGPAGLPATGGTAQNGILRVEQTTDNTTLDIGVLNGGFVGGAWLQVSGKAALGNDYPLFLNPNGGTVGIGTTNPASVFSVGAGSPFQVSSSGNLAAISGVPYTWPASNASGVLTNAGTGTLSWAPVSGGPWATTSAANIYNTNGGSVGIGTASPQAKLDVGGTTTNTGLSEVVRINGNASGGNGAALVTDSAGHGLRLYTTDFVNGSAGSRLTLELGTGSGNTFGAIHVANSGTNTTGNLALQPNGGNVGIGTTNPSFWLDVRGGGATANGSFRLLDADSGGGSLSINTFSGALANAVAGDALVSNTVGSLLISPNAAGKDLKFIGGTWSNPVSMVIRDGGNVGIGTTSPASLLTANVGSFSNNNSATAGVLVSGDATNNPGWAGYRITLNNTSGNYAGFVRAARTLGTTYIGLELGSESNHGIRFLTNGTGDAAERMRIDNTGNVGIGTTGPVGLFQVGAGTMTVLSSGNVGIGTASPVVKLEVNGNTQIDGAVAAYDTVGSGTQPLFTGLLSGANRIETKLYAVNQVGALDLADGAGNPATRLVGSGNSFFNGGYVGIGTTSPGSPLDVVGGVQSHAPNGNLSGYFGYGSGVDTGLLLLNYGGNRLIQLFANPGVASYFNAGAVGIGTTAPTASLEVKGGEIRFTEAATGKAIIDFIPGASLNKIQSNFYPGGSDIPLVLGTWANSANQLFLSTSGSVGIGTTSPAHTLDVNGAINGTSVLVNGVPISGGSISTQSPVTGLRSLGVQYQNNTGKPLFVAVSVSEPNANLAVALSDSSQFPTTIVAKVGITTGGSIQATTAIFQLFFVVLPGNWYVVSSAPNAALVTWTEWY